MPQHLRRGIDFQDLGLALLKGRIAALKIVAHLVRLDWLAVQHLVHRAGREFSQAGVTGGGSALACMRRQQAKRPQLMGITALLGFDAGLANQPGARRFRDVRPPS
ncbi:hypothetical protein [Roseomonas chloroacetimidivorans]|uniref:hypothetical protein n=1 Tax=Roseomonas chloroacetimidivorans TaxID=1766656 RepID=UPI003C77937D